MAVSAQYSVTIRVELDARQEPLGKLTAAIAEAGGQLQGVDLVPGAGSEGKRVREFTIDAQDREHWERILRAIGSTKGAKVLVLDPVDAASAGAIVNRAKQADIPVISYDRLITDADIDYYISFDNEQVGKLQGESLVKKLTDDGAKGDIVMINGAPTDNNAKLFKQGAHSVIDSSDFKVAKEYDTPDWSPDKAQQEMEQAITAVGKGGFVGVYAANDGTGGGAIAALKAAGINPSTIPVTGQDAELAAIQRILAGEQFMTVYKAIKPEAEAAAEAAVGLLSGTPPETTATEPAPRIEPGTAPEAPPPGEAGPGSTDVTFDANRPRAYRIGAGQAATVVVEVPEAGQVSIDGLGMTDTAEPTTPASFDVLTPNAGRYAVTFMPAGSPTPLAAGTLVVE